MTSASLKYCSTKNTNLLIQVLNVTRASIAIKASSGYQRAGGMKEQTQDLNHNSASTVMNGFIGCPIARDMNVYTQGYDHINASTVISVLSSQTIARSMKVLTHERNLRGSKDVTSASLSCQMLRNII